MKGVSDNNAHKKVKAKGSKSESKKPIQVLKLNKKDPSGNNNAVKDTSDFKKLDLIEDFADNSEKNSSLKAEDSSTIIAPKRFHEDKSSESQSNQSLQNFENPLNALEDDVNFSFERTVDDFDFDEDEFLNALNENEPIGLAGETIKGEIIAVESDGLYIDIGGKAPGFMPKKECGLGVITNFKEKFPINLEMEVLVIKEQNADGMVTVSARALILRKSWENVSKIAKNGELIQVLVNGFNRGGLTCDVEGLRGFIPRSQLLDGLNYQSLLKKIIKVAFLEVNPETRKLVLSEKKASLIEKFATLKLGQLIEGQVLAVKPYGFFIDLGGASGLLHQSSITNGSIRSLREIFVEGEVIKALITEIDLEKGRIGLNTALLENMPGELLIDKSKLMLEANDRALKTTALFESKDS